MPSLRFLRRLVPSFPILVGLMLSAGVAAAVAFAAGWTNDLSAQEPGASGRPLRIGVGYLPPPATPETRIYLEEGFELDLAEEIGRGLGAEVALVRLAPSEQAAALEAGRVDLVLARAGEEDRLPAGAAVLATGYESGLSLAMRADRPLRRWEELAGRTVCVSQANVLGQGIAERFGAKLRVLRAPAQALMLVRTGACDAAIHDRVLLDALFGKMSWQKFSATLPPVAPTALVVAVPSSRRDFAQALRRVLPAIGSEAQWQQRRAKWASTVSFEVYRDQVAADCH